MKVAFLTTDNREQRNEYDKPAPYFGPAPQAVLEGFKALGGELEVHVVSCSRRPMSAPAKIAENIHFHQPVVGIMGWGRTAFAGCALAVRRVLEVVQPDVIHGQGTERDCAVSMMLGPAVPKVLTIHGCMSEMQRLGWHEHRAYGILASTLEKMALRRADGVVCNSSYTKRLVENRARKTWLVPNAIQHDFFRPSKETRKEQVPTLVNVGLLSPYKRQIEILDMIGELHASGYAVRIVFAGPGLGDGEYARRFEARLGKAGGYATHAGALDRAGVIELFDGADGAIHFPAIETFGLVVAEALARGLKFFGGEVGGVPDVVDGISGAELHPDLDSMRASVARWLESGAPRCPDAAAGISDRYSPEVVARKHLEIYRELAGV